MQAQGPGGDEDRQSGERPLTGGDREPQAPSTNAFRSLSADNEGVRTLPFIGPKADYITPQGLEVSQASFDRLWNSLTNPELVPDDIAFTEVLINAHYIGELVGSPTDDRRAEVCNMLASTYAEQRDFELANAWLEHAYTLLEKSDVEASKIKMARTRATIADNSLVDDNLEDALQQFEQLDALSKEIGSTYMQANAAFAKAHITALTDPDNFKEAMHDALKSISAADEGSIPTIKNVLQVRTQIAMGRDEFPGAFAAMYQKFAEALITKCARAERDFRTDTAELETIVASTLTAQDNYIEAAKHYHNSALLFRDAGAEEAALSVTDPLLLTLEKAGKPLQVAELEFDRFKRVQRIIEDDLMKQYWEPREIKSTLPPLKLEVKKENMEEQGQQLFIMN